MTNFFTKIDQRLEGAPNHFLTIALIIAGIICWIVAMYGTASLKAAMLTWIVFP